MRIIGKVIWILYINDGGVEWYSYLVDDRVDFGGIY